MLKVTVDSNPEAKVSVSSVTKAAGGGGTGGFYIPSVSQPDANTMRVTYLQSDSSMPSVDSKDVTLPAGPAGPAGPSGADGQDGAPGADGIDGQDGVGIQSVEQTTTSTEDGGTNVVTVTKTDGTSSTFQFRNGSRGSTGPAGADGAAGADGHTPVKGTDYFTETDKQEIAEQAAGMVSIPEKLPNPNALTFTGAATGTYDGSAPLEINIPIGGSSGGSGKAKTQKLIDITFSEPTASLSVTLEHDFHKLFLVWNCGSNGVARTVDADGNAVSGNLGILLDTTSFGWNARKILQIGGNTSTWQTTAGFIQYTDDLSTLLQSSARDITTATKVNTNNIFGGTSAMIGTLGDDALAPTAGRTVNIVTSSGFFAATTRIVLVGEYYE